MATITVIDDEPLVQRTVADILEAGGHQVILPPADGSLLARLLAGPRSDLVLTDLRMPRHDGWDVAQWVRENWPGVPVLALTGYVADAKRRAQGSPFMATLPKPVEIDLLLAAVTAALGRATVW